MKIPRRPRKPILLAGLLALALSAASGAFALDQALIEQINDLVSRGEKLIAENDRDAGLKLIYQANDLAYASDEDGLLAGLLPNLAIARDEMAQKDYAAVEKYAVAVANGMDTPEFANHPNRLEALMLLGISLDRRKKYTEAMVTLQTAMRGIRDNPAAARLYDQTILFLARTATAVKSKDAADLRKEAIENIDRVNPDINQKVFAYLMSSDLRDRWRGGERGQTIVDDAKKQVDYANAVAGMRTSEKSYFTGFYALALISVKDFEHARALLQDRREYLLAHYPKSASLLWNAQRLASVLRRLRQYPKAKEVLKDTIARAQAVKSPKFAIIAKLQRDLGHLANAEGDKALAQQYFRQAYSSMRRIASAGDPRVVQIRKYINFRVDGFSDFPFAVEVAGNYAIKFSLRTDGAYILRYFLRGNFQINEQIIAARARKDTGKTREFYLNAALNDALIGRQAEALANLNLARTEPTGKMARDAKFIDFIEALVFAWSTEDHPENAVPALDRLQARTDLNPTERRLLLSLQANYQTNLNQIEGAGTVVRAWIAAFDDTEKPTTWDYFSGTLIAEIGFWALEPKEADRLYSRITTWLIDLDNFTLAKKLLRLSQMTDGVGAAEGQEGLIELGALVKTVQGLVPQTSLIQTSSQFTYAMALVQRGQIKPALDMVKIVTKKYGSSLYRREDTMAFLFSQQSGLLAQLGEPKLAMSMAKEAYARIDRKTARGNLLASVVETYIYHLVQANDYDVAAEIAAGFCNDPAIMARITPYSQIRLLIAYGKVLLEQEKYAAAQSVYDRAARTLPYDSVKFAGLNSNLRYEQAIGYYRSGDYAKSFASVHLSNEIFHQLQTQLAANLVGDRDRDANGLSRVQAEALIGWDFAQTLPE